MTATYTVKITVSDNWLDDGFDMSSENINEIIHNGMSEALPYAYEGEIEVDAKMHKLNAKNDTP